MGRRGPAPTPTPILEARGSWRAKARKSEPKLTGPLGRPPAGLSATARAEWRRVVKAMMAANMGADVDAAALAAYCRTCDEWRKLVKITHRRDFDYYDENCRMVSRLLGAVEDRLSKLAQQFGFTPASRSRVQAESVPSESDAGAGVEAKFFGKPRVHRPDGSA